MSETEQELFRLIRENDNPSEALMTAAAVMIAYLTQPESFEVQAPAFQTVSV
jgi:hypothetical protein